VLAGLASLEERFAHPRLDCFSQRLAARCYLTPLDQGETARYIQAQIAGSEGDPDSVFAADALAAAHSATDGVPRLINQLCDHALLMASAGGVRQLTAAGIEEAWADLQQLPAPWCAGSSSVPQAGENVIEFGGLDGASDVVEELETDQTAPIAAAEPELELAGVAAAEPAWSAASDDETQPDQGADDEADFEPAGSIGPEVELVLGGHPNPFAESFDDEEVVIDQYAVLEENVFDQQPQVAARGDAMSLQLLRQLPNLDQRPSLSLAGTADDADERWSATGPGTATVGSESDTSGHAPELPTRPDLGPAERPALDDGADPATDDVPADHDLIIVTDDAEEDQPTGAVTTVCAQQYRQLFAQLRRG
jgi:hypothetical protein